MFLRADVKRAGRAGLVPHCAKALKKRRFFGLYRVCRRAGFVKIHTDGFINGKNIRRPGI
jgi:hypothetical protein